MIEKIGFFSLIEKKEARLLSPLSLIKEKKSAYFFASATIAASCSNSFFIKSTTIGVAM
jgi:hypothetical protein